MEKWTPSIPSTLHVARLNDWVCSKRVARIWKRGGGAILKEWEVCKRPWLEFSLILNQFQTVCPKIETKCLGKLGNSKVFSSQNLGDLQKKKKKKVFTKIETDFSSNVANSDVWGGAVWVNDPSESTKIFYGQYKIDAFHQLFANHKKETKFPAKCVLIWW